MKRILIPVDGTRGTRDIFAVCGSIVRQAEEVILLHVEQLGGKTLMLDMLGEPELATLRESIQGTPFRERLDAQTARILAYCRSKLEALGAQNIRTMVRDGMPALEILKVAAMEQADLIVLGNNGGTAMDQLISGSVTKEVERRACVPVLVVKNSGGGEAALAWREAYAAR